MTCANPPCCGGDCENWSGNTSRYLLTLEYDYSDAGPLWVFPKYLVGAFNCGSGSTTNQCLDYPFQFEWWTILTDRRISFSYNYTTDGTNWYFNIYLESPLTGYFYGVWHGTGYSLTYDLGTDLPPDDLSTLDLSVLTPVVTFYDGVTETEVRSTIPILTNITFTSITKEQFDSALECKVCWEWYVCGFDYVFDYDPTSASPPPYSCCLIGEITEVGEDPLSWNSIPYVSWNTGGGIGGGIQGWVVMFSGGPYFYMSSGHLYAQIGSTSIDLGTTWPADLPFDMDFVDEPNPGQTTTFTEWGDAESCFNTFVTDCYGASVPDYIRLEVERVCEPGALPSVICLERVGETCNYVSLPIYEFEVTATIDDSLLLTFDSETYFGPRYSFTQQLSASNYLNSSSTINNALPAANDEDRYVGRILITWTAAPDCGIDTLDEDDCPLCADGSQNVKCISGAPELTTALDGPLGFSFTRTAACLWTADDVYWCGEDTAPYSATLTGAIDGCLVTFTVRITHDGAWVEYERRYNVNNASTDCTGAYLLQESARSGVGVLPELDDSFHLNWGDFAECEPFDWETEYCVPTKLRVLYGAGDVQMDLDLTDQTGDVLTYGPNANDCEPGEPITITVVVSVVDRWCIHIGLSSVVYPPSICDAVSGEAYTDIGFFRGGSVVIDGCDVSFEPFECP